MATELATRLSQKHSPAMIAAAASENTSAFGPAPSLNRPKLMPWLKVSTKSKNGVTRTERLPNACPVKNESTAALLS